MSTVVQVDRSELDGETSPVDASIEQPVDGRRRRDLYTGALERATGKDVHGAAAGTLELGSRWSWKHEPGVCNGRLRAVYMRVTSTPARYHGAGKTSWVTAGVVCDSCDAFWPKPRA